MSKRKRQRNRGMRHVRALRQQMANEHAHFRARLDDHDQLFLAITDTQKLAAEIKALPPQPKPSFFQRLKRRLLG